MAETTAIEWCDATANLWWGCQHVHAGCDHCYAEAEAKRRGKGWDLRYEVRGVWDLFARLQRKAINERRRLTVFVGSMFDIFEKPQPLATWQGGLTPTSTGTPRQKFFRDVVPACPDLTFLLLTKRPSKITGYVPWEWLEPGRWPANVWTGASVSDQATLDILATQLLQAPGPHYLSYEPALGEIDLSTYLADLAWVIAGGESGHHPRPPQPDWFRSVRDQCRAAGVPFLFKQWGEFGPSCDHFTADQLAENNTPTVFHGGSFLSRVGKKKAGRLLDGREHLEFPSFEPCTEVA